jgi:glycosyltransferase involved in cell wall biosynthesis
MFDISVVICTHNRCQVLVHALASLVGQLIDPARFEVVVVNNGCTDKTNEVIETFRAQHPRHTIVAIDESRLGLSIARNTGIAYARGPYVAFLDDDAQASPGWLERALHWYTVLGEELLCVGGPIKPYYISPKPAWFCDEYETYSLGDRPRPLRPGEYLCGSNMIWRKSLFSACPGFDTPVGVRGAELSVGEETLLFERLWQSSNRVLFYYDPALEVKHLVPSGKMTFRYRWKRGYVAGRDWVTAHGPWQRFRRARFLARYPLKLSKSLFTALLRLPRSRGWSNWLSEQGSEVAYNLGLGLGLLGVSVPVRQVAVQLPTSALKHAVQQQPADAA